MLLQESVLGPNAASRRHRTQSRLDSNSSNSPTTGWLVMGKGCQWKPARIYQEALLDTLSVVRAPFVDVFCFAGLPARPGCICTALRPFFQSDRCLAKCLFRRSRSRNQCQQAHTSRPQVVCIFSFTCQMEAEYGDRGHHEDISDSEHAPHEARKPIFRLVCIGTDSLL